MSKPKYPFEKRLEVVNHYFTTDDLARLGRKSLSFSKSVELHDKVIGHYLNIKHYQ
ncbi:IS1 family transposase [Escherichia coli]|uniref:IS1 family transposase n=1 Tax=Escherichia coli TaxID=562 RepID=UPI00216A9026|nr:IS1 family transposase [Escherichia coli]MBW9614590.1 hypothetical protein [Escherichia coli]